MKVAVLSESGADEAAIRRLVEGLLAERAEPASMPPIRSRGFGAVLRDLPMVLRHLHYRTDAEALVVVLDSDRSPVHTEAHKEPGGDKEKCRLCRMAKIVAQVRRDLAQRPTYPPLKIGLGLAVPQIEAWYLAGRDPHVSEAAWNVGLCSGKPPHTSDSLKQKVYGTDDPPWGVLMACALKEVERIVREGRLPQLEQLFPGGFGALARDVRNW